MMGKHGRRLGTGIYINSTATQSPVEKKLPMGHQMEVYVPNYTASNRQHNFPTAMPDNPTPDNQAATKRLRTLKPGPGQEIADTLTHEHRAQHLKLYHYSTAGPGHTDVTGNEKPTMEKLATTQKPPTFFRTSLPYLKRVVRAN